MDYGKYAFRFADLFAGIGGFHVSMAGLGGECVWGCEINAWERDLYRQNFGIELAGDITKVDFSQVPDFDLLCGGFPCQPFSTQGKRQGFHDEKGRGLLYLRILDALRTKQPRLFILENVKGLLTIDRGEAFRTILEDLRACGYDVDYTLISPTMLGVPQSRQRVYIVGRRREVGGLGDILNRFTFPPLPKKPIRIGDFVDFSLESRAPLGPRMGYRANALWALLLLCQQRGIPYPEGEVDILQCVAGNPKASGFSWFQHHAGTLTEWVRHIDTTKLHGNFTIRVINPPEDIRRAVGLRAYSTITDLRGYFTALDTKSIPHVYYYRHGTRRGGHLTPREILALQGLEGLPHIPASRQRVQYGAGNAVNVQQTQWVAHALLQYDSAQGR